MRPLKTCGAVIAALLLTISPAWADARGDEAAALFDRGLSVLEEGEIAKAADLFLQASKAEPESKSYREHASLLRRVQQIRGVLAREKDAARWEQAAQSLRAFYYDFGVYGEALALDRQRHEKQGSLERALDLAESQLEMGLAAQVEVLLGKYADEKRNTRLDLLLGIAQARQGRKEEAAKCAERARIAKEEANARLLLERACLDSLLGEPTRAAVYLVRSFELTPPSRLDKSKAYAKARADLAALWDSPAAEMAWKTESKVKESSCSSGSSCGKCPKRSACGSEESEPEN
jgi:tetratricopeptide (TPR) repeat protein